MTRNSATVSLPNAPSIQWFLPLIWVALLAMCIVGMPLLEGLFRWVEPDARQVVYDRAGIAVTRERGRDFLPLVGQLASLGQTFPPVAVLALAVPVLGFGTLPIIVALMLYGLLPIVRNTLAGINDVRCCVTWSFP